MEHMNSLFSLIHDFLLIALPKERKCSKNTIRAYKKSLELLLDFVKEKTGKPFVNLTFEDIDRNILTAFLDHLESERNCSFTVSAHFTDMQRKKISAMFVISMRLIKLNGQSSTKPWLSI